MKRRRAVVQAATATPLATLVPDPTVEAKRARLGDLFVVRGTAPREAVEEAVADVGSRRVGEVLLDQGVIDEAEVTSALGVQLDIFVRDLRTVDPEATAAALIDAADAHRAGVLPLSLVDGSLTVAIADPFDESTVALLRSLPVESVHLQLAVPSQLRNRVNQLYRALATVDNDIEAYRASDAASQAALSVTDLVDDADAPVIQLVNKIVTQALRDRASDVHIEPGQERVRVRYRIDGALKEILEIPAEMAAPLLSRLKIMAHMNIVERRRPQDGQFDMHVDGRALDVRVSTTSTIWGEKAVLRLLDRTRSLYQLGDLGMPPDSAELYSRLVSSPIGMVVIGGPTGSGKTTTLYATLSEINRPDINVMTIEDPVEYVFEKVNQIQISEQAGLTFATGLKSILRQDPDVILVGEVRDVETARLAVQSALTGHRVFSSIHAIDAVSALYRLLDMGIESFLVTSAITGVIAQRLVRRICMACAEPYEPSLQELAIYRKLGGVERDAWVKGAGCRFCADTGYFERIGVYEVLPITDELRQCVVDGRSPRAAREIATDQGMRSLQTEAVRMVEHDITTMEEVIKHVLVREVFE
jgi:type IV pilus assembly protein PilB